MGEPGSPEPQCTAPAYRVDEILASLHSSGKDPNTFFSRDKISLIELFEVVMSLKG